MKAPFKAAVPRESDISLEPLQISSKRRNFTPTCWETWRGSSGVS